MSHEMAFHAARNAAFSTAAGCRVLPLTCGVRSANTTFLLPKNFFRSSAVTLKVEGLYVNLDNNNGRAQAPLVGAAISPVGLVPVYSLSGISRNENAFAVVRAGLNYKFGSY